LSSLHLLLYKYLNNICKITVSCTLIFRFLVGHEKTEVLNRSMARVFVIHFALNDVMNIMLDLKKLSFFS